MGIGLGMGGGGIGKIVGMGDMGVEEVGDGEAEVDGGGIGAGDIESMLNGIIIMMREKSGKKYTAARDLWLLRDMIALLFEPIIDTLTGDGGYMGGNYLLGSH